MNNMTYIGIGIVVVIIIIGVLVFTGSPSSGSTTSAQTTATQSLGSTVATTTAAQTTAETNMTNSTKVNPYNTTTTIVSSNEMMSNSTPSGCTATKYYSCSKFVWGSSNITATVGQTTGLNWSSFGVAYVPAGTTFNSGVPQGVTFYSANTSATNNVGTSLANGASASITLPVTGNNKHTWLNLGLLHKLWTGIRGQRRLRSTWRRLRRA